MKSIYAKYADLLTNYCIKAKLGDKILIKSSYLAEPLLKELIVAIGTVGAMPIFDIEFQDQTFLTLQNVSEEMLKWENPTSITNMEQINGYISILSSFNLRSTQHIDPIKRSAYQAGNATASSIYTKRTGNYDLRRTLCLFPTQAAAQEAKMSLTDYENFVYNACKLFAENPENEWKKLSANQSKIVEHLNTCSNIHYKGPNVDIQFSTNGRTWINSDGQTNMPSGEVYTAPVENSVNGYIKFSFPGLYFGKEAQNIELWVENGTIVKWDASQGKDLLDDVFKIPGARVFGEAAIGTNADIQTMTRNILFDEKIGGTIHMAVGQSYPQCGGKNESSVHWDMITSMTNDSYILADGNKIYENGSFLI